jgi:Protein of unknown function (DUF2785)
MRISSLLLWLAFVPYAAATTHGNCPPPGHDRDDLDALKARGFDIADDAKRNALALALTACLADPDPRLRDGVAYEAFHTWLRGQALTAETMLALADDLEARLVAPEGQGFERPFAALALSEVARADRIHAFLSPKRRARLLDAAISFFGGVRDYRGFDEREGWRHGVAHGADLLLQLGVNPAFGEAELARIRDAIATQVAAPGHFYVHGEPERLAAPLIFIARRGIFSAEDWSTWFARFAEPAQWENSFASLSALAKRHNTMAFLSALYLNARLSDDAADDALLPGVEAALKSIP